MDCDLLIVGAGPVGCVIAERAATQRGWRSIVVDKRDHVAGNCHDRFHESGVMIHAYGPHYFRTNDQKLLDYLSPFTEWIPGDYVVKSRIGDTLYPIPINLDTLEMFFHREFTPESAEAFLAGIRADITDPKNSEEFVLSRVGKELYEAFYLGYTLKQWERHPRDLDPSVCGRIPIRMNRDNRYVDHGFQVMPAKGYTALFAKMLDHPKIETMLSTEFSDVRGKIAPRVATVYCGPVDAYFENALGKLPWRSLEFEFVEHPVEYVQPCVQINEPSLDVPYTRTVEIKHATKQQHPHTVISIEYPRAEGDPYYPVPAAENRVLYERYKAMADEETRTKNVYFAGRLATYRYINTDQALEEALRTFDRISQDHPDA